MADLEVEHEFVATIPLGPDPDQVQSEHWNAGHILTGNLPDTRVALDGAIAPYADDDDLHTVLSGIVASIVTATTRFFKIRKNSTGSDFSRSRINLIEGTGIVLTVADDAGNDEVDVTIAATAGSAAGGWEAVSTTGTKLETGRTEILDANEEAVIDMDGQITISPYTGFGLVVDISGTTFYADFSGAGKGIRLTQHTTDPSGGVVGIIYWDTFSTTIRYYDGSAWNSLASEGYVDAHVTDATDAHDASAISILDTGGYYTGTDVEAALQEIGAAGASGGVDVEDEGTPLTNPGTTLNFTGAGVTASGSGGTKTINIPGGGGGGGWDPAIFISREHSYIHDECIYSGGNPFNGGVVPVTSNGSVANTNGDIGHPGCVLLSTTTNAAGRAALYTNSASGPIALSGGSIRFGVVAKLTTLSDGTNTYTARHGICDSATGDGNHGIFFRYTDGVNSGKWQLVGRDGTSETGVVDSGVTADTNWHTFEWEVNAAGTSCTFYIDGTSVGTVTTDLPASTRRMGLLPGGIYKSLGATARTMQIDAYWYIFDFTTDR